MVSPRLFGHVAYAAYHFLETTMLTQHVRERIMRVIARTGRVGAIARAAASVAGVRMS
jgi:hypothetical protein